MVVLLGSPVDDLVLLHLKTLADWSVSVICDDGTLYFKTCYNILT